VVLRIPGDWSGLVDEVAADLAPVYGDGARAVGLTAPGQTRNQARSDLGLPPLPEDAPESGDQGRPPQLPNWVVHVK
jgi:hypothetical protein